MNKHLKIVGSMAVMGTLLMAGGCGSGSSTTATAPTTQASVSAIAPTSVTAGAAAGTLTVATPITANSIGGATAFSIPAGITITPPPGKTFSASAPPSITVTSYNGTAAMPATKTAGFVVDSMAGAVDVQIGDIVNGITFTGGKATITIPITSSTSSCEVFVNKNDGNGYTDLGPALTCGGGFATIAVSNLCNYSVNTHFSNGVTGSTGGTGSSGF